MIDLGHQSVGGGGKPAAVIARPQAGQRQRRQDGSNRHDNHKFDQSDSGDTPATRDTSRLDQETSLRKRKKCNRNREILRVTLRPASLGLLKRRVYEAGVGLSLHIGHDDPTRLDAQAAGRKQGDRLRVEFVLEF